MNTESKLRLQAYLDNEVSSGEARQIASWIARDADAKALFEELQVTKAMLVPDNELEVTLPEGHDFYWSKIQRGIASAEREPAVAEVHHKPWWIRLFAPVAGAAALAVFVFTSFQSPAHLIGGQKEVSQTDSSITFYSPAQKMMVVWIPSGQESAEASTSNAEEVQFNDVPQSDTVQQDEAL